MRLKPRFNPEVNQWWMCDEGRYGFKSIDAPSRILQPQIKRGGELEPLSWNEAIKEAVQRINHALEDGGRNSVVVIASPQSTNEDLFITRKLFREDLGLSQIYFRVPDRNPKTEDNFLLRADKNPNTRGATAIFSDPVAFDPNDWSKIGPRKEYLLLLIFEHDLFNELGASVASNLLQQFDYVIYQGSNANETSAQADLILPSATYAETEGTFTNFEGRVQRIHQAVYPLGDSLPTWQIVNTIGRALGFEYPYEDVEDIFADITKSVVEFDGLTYEKVGESGVMLAGASSVQT